MKLSLETVDYVAGLARLILSDEEKMALASDMADILTYVDKLSELDTENVLPMEHVMPVANVLRADETAPSYDRDKLLANAPALEDGCIRVPKIVE